MSIIVFNVRILVKDLDLENLDLSFRMSWRFEF